MQFNLFSWKEKKTALAARFIKGFMLALFAVSALSGCTGPVVKTFEEPSLPSDQIAILRPYRGLSPVSCSSTWIRAIDGRQVERFSNPFEYSVFAIRPGAHAVEVQPCNYQMTQTLNFTAERGKTYRVRDYWQGALFGGKHRFWVEDLDTGDAVAETVCQHEGVFNTRFTNCEVVRPK